MPTADFANFLELASGSWASGLSFPSGGQLMSMSNIDRNGVFLTFFSFVPKSVKRVLIFHFCKDDISP